MGRRLRHTLAAWLVSLAVAPCLFAAAYTLERPEDALIGALGTIQAVYEDTLPDVARTNGLGHEEIKLANPGVDTWLPGAGQEVVLPKLFVVPQVPRTGIVLNIPEMRLYYFPPVSTETGAQEVVTHPIGIGRVGWSTPYINTRIIQKTVKPYWHPTESILKEYAEMGEPLSRRVPPGPDNPLGDYAMRLGQPEYIIHGTNKPYGVGMRVSHGCIRLYPEDIESLFRQVTLQTPVNIINQPYKVARHGTQLYLEAHPYLEEDAEQFQDNLTAVVEQLIVAVGALNYELDRQAVEQIVTRSDGIPTRIGRVQEGGL